MTVETLDSILQVKTYFSNNKVCCTTFTPNKTMYNLFNYRIYDTNQTDDDLDLDDDILTIFE